MRSKQNAVKHRPILQRATGKQKSARQVVEQDPDPDFDVLPCPKPRPKRKANPEQDLDPVIEEEEPRDVSIQDILSGQEVFELDLGEGEGKGDEQEDDENGKQYPPMGLDTGLLVHKRATENLASPSMFPTKMPLVILWSN